MVAHPVSMSNGLSFLRARSDQMVGKECTWNAVGPGFKPHMWGGGVIFLCASDVFSVTEFEFESSSRRINFEKWKKFKVVLAIIMYLGKYVVEIIFIISKLPFLLNFEITILVDRYFTVVMQNIYIFIIHCLNRQLILILRRGVVLLLAAANNCKQKQQLK